LSILAGATELDPLWPEVSGGVSSMMLASFTYYVSAPVLSLRQGNGIITVFVICIMILPSYVDIQAWVTLGRAQLNFGEPDSAILSFDKALTLKVPILLGNQLLFSSFLGKQTTPISITPCTLWTCKSCSFTIDLLDYLHSLTTMMQKLTVKLQPVLLRNEDSCIQQV
jgi:hypothetical protein